MSEFLLQLDYDVLHFFNVTLSNPVLDQFWLLFTDLHKHWWGILIMAAALIYPAYIYKMGIVKVIAALALAIALTDAITYRVFKKAIGRERPSRNVEIAEWLRPVGEAHGPSFPSNHASNCFAAATVLAWYFRKRRHYFYTFAFLVAISRPALGVHYPSDIAAGAILGISVAMICRTLILQRVKWFRLE